MRTRLVCQNSHLAVVLEDDYQEQTKLLNAAIILIAVM